MPITRSARFEPPERLDAPFGLLAGLYVAALVSPPALLLVAERLTHTAALLALGGLGASVTAVVAWEVTRRGSVVTWFDSGWATWLVPGVAGLAAFPYLWYVVEFLAFAVTDLEPETPASLLGALGVALAIGASCVGTALVHMARNRAVDAAVSEADVAVEWSAAWPKRQLVKTRLAVAAVPLALAVVAAYRYRESPGLAVSVFNSVGLLVVVLRALGLEYRYRVTPWGIDRSRTRLGFTARSVFGWEAFEGFSVTEDAVVLHRPFPRLDLRCARWDMVENEEAVVEALAEHLDRRE